MIRIKAPEGYKIHDTMTDRDYSEIVIKEADKARFSLVPDYTETITEEVTL